MSWTSYYKYILFLAFIKKGANSATVEIKIKNSSPKAYKHDVYGDYITVVRTITSSGSSSYKIKSASGKFIIDTYTYELYFEVVDIRHAFQKNSTVHSWKACEVRLTGSLGE